MYESNGIKEHTRTLENFGRHPQRMKSNFVKGCSTFRVTCVTILTPDGNLGKTFKSNKKLDLSGTAE